MMFFKMSIYARSGRVGRVTQPKHSPEFPARFTCSNAMTSVKAHGPRPKARSTILASPTMPSWRANIPAWPLHSARMHGHRRGWCVEAGCLGLPDDGEVLGGGFAVASGPDFEADFLSFAKRAEPRPFDGRDVDEGVL